MFTTLSQLTRTISFHAHTCARKRLDLAAAIMEESDDMMKILIGKAVKSLQRTLALYLAILNLSTRLCKVHSYVAMANRLGLW